MNVLFGDFDPEYAALSTVFEPNDTMETAAPLGKMRHRITGSGTDWFVVEAGPSEISLAMTHAAEQAGRQVDLSLTLVSPTGQGLAADYQPSRAERSRPSSFSNRLGQPLIRLRLVLRAGL